MRIRKSRSRQRRCTRSWSESERASCRRAASRRCGRRANASAEKARLAFGARSLRTPFRGRFFRELEEDIFERAVYARLLAQICKRAAANKPAAFDDAN